MSLKNFVIDYLKLLPEKDYNKGTVELIGGVVDSSKDG